MLSVSVCLLSVCPQFRRGGYHLPPASKRLRTSSAESTGGHRSGDHRPAWRRRRFDLHCADHPNRPPPPGRRQKTTSLVAAPVMTDHATFKIVGKIFPLETFGDRYGSA
jgi:hypothetical protein